MTVQESELGQATVVGMVKEAAEQVFSTMLGIDLQPGDAYVNTSASQAANGVVSFIGLAGAYVGTGSLSCSAPFACKMASQLMMTEYHSVDDEVLDAVAEITNMILGNVKTMLEERIGPMGLSIPTVVYGRNFTSRTVGKHEWTVVPFAVDGDCLEVQLCLAPKTDASRVRLAFAGQEVA